MHLLLAYGRGVDWPRSLTGRSTGSQSCKQEAGSTCAYKHGLLQVLSAVELARKARIAANRAYLASITGQDASTGGEAPDQAGQTMLTLPVDHALVLRAARRLADAAAAQEARAQVATLCACAHSVC